MTGDSVAVSIILPTYNRSQFLPEAIAAIRSQQLTDWELIVVDDGSTDDTSQVLPQLLQGMSQPYRYVQQENLGAYAARNRGVAEARGNCIAFYDSDDLWLPHHLRSSWEVLQQHADVEWVYAAGRIVDWESGRVLQETCFYPEGRPRPFLNVGERREGILWFAGADAVLAQLCGGLYCGLQASLIRSRVFRDRKLPTRPNGGDQFFLIECLLDGLGVACIDDVHFEYRIHETNSSAAGVKLASVARQERVYRSLIEGFEELLASKRLDRNAVCAARRELAEHYCWKLGYSCYWRNGQRREALSAYRHAIETYPWDWRYWKTLLLALARTGPKARA